MKENMIKHRDLTEGFHRLSRQERLNRVQTICGLTNEDLRVLTGETQLSSEVAEHLIENVVGYFPIPLGLATNFKIDEQEVLIPMAVEETSIVAASSATAKWVAREGFIRTSTRGRLIIGQIQIPQIQNRERVQEVSRKLESSREQILEAANCFVPGLVERGGGIVNLQVRELSRSDDDGSMLVIHLLCDAKDAMGANLINQVCEGVKPLIEELTGEKVGLCILSNLVDTKLAVAEVRVRGVDPEVGKGIQEAAIFAKSDPYRAATHNKGVLNGIDPILIATGNDWRAVEAGAHAYASRSGTYQPLTDWKMEGTDLVGRIELPMSVGVVGGVTRVHPTARVALKILGNPSGDALGRICAAVGLVQNLGALKALATVGIVKGHMQLHTTNLALAAGAELHEISQVKEKLVEALRVEKRVNLSRAREILEALRVARGSSVSI